MILKEEKNTEVIERGWWREKLWWSEMKFYRNQEKIYASKILTSLIAHSLLWDQGKWRLEKSILKEVISLEEYKKKVYDCLIKNQKCSIQGANDLMTEYEEDFPEFYEENWTPEAVACGMAMKYL